MSQPPLKDLAIDLALRQDWKQAIRINLQIIKEEKTNIDAHNRLGYAYMKNGQPIKSKEIFSRVLKLDPYNQIASKNLKKLNLFKKNGTNMNMCEDISPLLFLEEPGKTKIIELINVTDKKIISNLRSGEKLALCIKRMKIFALDQDNQYIGMLPDDLCKRLIKFINVGNKYEAYARTVESNKITIFIRELKRVKRYEDQPSFVSTEKTKLAITHSGIGVKNQPENKNGKSHL